MFAPNGYRPPGRGRSGAALRRHDRCRFAATVQLLLGTGRIVQARTLDISQGGVQLLLPLHLPVDTVCRLLLSVPAAPSGTRAVAAEARVTSIVLSGRESGFLAGLRFLALPPASQAGLEHYLRQRQEQRIA